MTGITIYSVKRKVTPKAGNSKLWFLCSAHYIMVICICIKFQENISNNFQVIERTHILQKSLISTSKGHYSKSRLSRVTVLYSAPWLIMLYICVKFHQNI